MSPEKKPGSEAETKLENSFGNQEKLVELLDAVLNALDEGLAVLDAESRVSAWNPAATAVTGFLRAEMLGRELPEGFYTADAAGPGSFPGGRPAGWGERPVPVKLRHSQGHTLPAMLRLTTLRDGLGRRSGTLLRFHPTEDVDALPRGAMEEEDGLEHPIEHSQADLEDRLDEAWQEWVTAAVPFGLLWVTVDQGEALRKTHGRDASEAMLAIVEKTLSHALRPAEILGRWGSHEFLVLCHERTSEMLLRHGRHVAELARGADFRWWGDRVPLTVSIGAVQAGPILAPEEDKLSALLLRAQRGMQAGRVAGGNTVVLEQSGASSAESGGNACSQS